MTNKQIFSTTQLKKITLFGYFSLLIFMPVWLILITEDRALSIPLTLAMFTLPLLFPLKGLLQGNPYTYAWSNFIVMIYFLHSLTTIWVSVNERHWALLEFTFATIMFIAGSYYAKYRGQELGLSIRKKKE
ncbi:DUF2069 domain-containing protein [Cognaticolwellia mytili]|uniref:DUF2069 domain-containing protein n=1 Tax=Cognaticolwellia mytili TaxID=1888913 RepID=UPI000A173B57|nr:DUF2069 domain-containing protein [Cognaticolwellia mytili]